MAIEVRISRDNEMLLTSNASSVNATGVAFWIATIATRIATRRIRMKIIGTFPDALPAFDQLYPDQDDLSDDCVLVCQTRRWAAVAFADETITLRDTGGAMRFAHQRQARHTSED